MTLDEHDESHTYGPFSTIFPIAFKVITNEKHVFYIWFNHIRDRKGKRNRCWARERKCFSTINSSNYVKMHQEKILQDRPRSAILDKMTNISRIVCTNNSRQTLRVGVRWSVCRGLFQNPTHDYCVKTGTKRPSRSIFMPVFPSNCRVCDKTKNPCCKNQGLPNSVVVILVCKP